MRRLGSVVQPLVATMINVWEKVTDGHATAAQFVCHEDAWHTPSLHQLHQETHGCMGVSRALFQDLQYISVGVDGIVKLLGLF